MELEKQYKIMKDWYWRGDIKFNMKNYTIRRETVIMTPKHLKPQITFRNRRVHNIQGFDFFIKFAKSKGANIIQFYYSMAEYKKGLPYTNSKNIQEIKEKWKEEHHKHMTKYDCLIDIDAPNHDYFNIAKETTINVIKELQKQKIPCYVRYSGMGFHIIIKYEDFPKSKEHSFDPYAEKNIYQEMIKFNKKLYDKISELIDYNLNDSRRIAKIPYSLAFYKNNTFVCLPILTMKELKESDLDYFKYDNWKDKTLFNRGETPIK